MQPRLVAEVQGLAGADALRVTAPACTTALGERGQRGGQRETSWRTI
jgi:hypothetical protein